MNDVIKKYIFIYKILETKISSLYDLNKKIFYDKSINEFELFQIHYDFLIQKNSEINFLFSYLSIWIKKYKEVVKLYKKSNVIDKNILKSIIEAILITSLFIRDELLKYDKTI